MKRNDGFTLVELMVTILAATIVTVAAATVLLFGLRVNNESTKTASQQNTANIVLTVLGDLAEEKCASVDGSTDNWRVLDEEGDTLFSYNKPDIYVNSSSLMTVKSANATLTGNLLTLEIEAEDGTKYKSSVYCRTIEPTETTVPSGSPPEVPANGSGATRMLTEDPIDLTPDLSNVSHAEGREAFLSILTSEEGSTGYSLTTGEYFSEWYIGSYADNPSWNTQTPWCACFVSWALDQCSDYLAEVPRFAHVDKFMYSFGRVRWKTVDPDPGDVIFFDWIENQASYPQHVGVVLNVSGGTVYTIEGNTDGVVAVRQYPENDPRILGYGVLKWK